MKVYKKLTFFLVLPISLLGILIVWGNGCSGDFTPVSDTTDTSSSVAAAEEDTFGIVPNAKTVSTLYSNQALDHFSQCANLKKPSEESEKVYQNKRGAISILGAPDTITSPMIMATTSIAGEVCLDLINQEKNTAKIFENFNLAGDALPASNSIKTAVNKLSLSCWGRAAENEEVSIIEDLVLTSVKSSEQNKSVKSALLICTSILASLDGITY